MHEDHAGRFRTHLADKGSLLAAGDAAQGGEGGLRPVVGDDGLTRMVRSCVEGPVFYGDRVRWDDVGTVPPDTVGAITAPGAHR